jgi:chromosome segregation ATPase
MKYSLNQLAAIFAVLLITALSFSCNQSNGSSEVSDLKSENDSLGKIIEQRDSLMNEVMEAFYQIEKDLSFIKEKRNIISVKTDNPEIEKSRKDQIVQDVKDLANLLQENKKEISALNKKLKKSGLNIKSLEARITELSESAENRNSEIISLKSELEKKDYEVTILNEQVAVLETEKEKNEVLIADQKVKIDNYNKAYYTLGTEKELEQKGVIKREGGFLGLGKTKLLSPEIKLDYFSEYDIRSTKSIEVRANNAELISEHPEGSYEFVTEEDKITYLAINNINEFYKFSKYVVLEVK